MQISYVKKIEGSAVVGFLARAWVALLDNNKWEERSVLLSGDLQCVYAAEGDEILGAVTFFIDEDEGYGTINLAYVSPEHRHKHIMSRMWDLAAHQLKLQNAGWISVVCYPTNEEIAGFCKSIGGRIYTHQYRIDLA